jgi:thiol-disulfide isomerase/thioredoxin
MKSVFIHDYIVDFYRYLILLIIIGIVRQTSSGVVPSRDSASLYTSNDKINILSGENFTSIVYESKTAWLVEFYASWCGHCQSYANVRFNFVNKNLSYYFY